MADFTLLECPKLISRKILVIEKNYEISILHSVEKREFLSHRKKISWNQLFSNFFSKTVGFTKFLSKKSEREFPQFPNCAVITNFSRKFRENNMYTCISLISRNIFQIFLKMIERFVFMSLLSFYFSLFYNDIKYDFKSCTCVF